MIGQNWKVAISDLEFDQPLVLNEAHLCPLSHLPCPTQTCTPCDWTKNSADVSVCRNPQCCGPTQFTETNFPEFTDEWCLGSTPYEVLEWNNKSSVKALNTSDIAHYRFFFPESMGCISFRVTIRYLYGNLNIFVSNRYPLPYSTNNQWDAKFSNQIPGYGYAQTDIDICPNFHSNYAHGTYAVTIEALQDSAYYLELIPGNTHPIPTMVNPPTTTKCSSSPFDSASYTCVDDGESQPLLIPDGGFASQYLQYVFPIDPGCQHVSVAVWPVVESQKDTSCDSDLFCYLISENPVMSNFNALAGTYRIGSDVEYATLCPTKPMWLQCAVQPWFQGDLYVVYSTRTPSLTKPLDELPLYDFSVHSGFASSSIAYFDTSSTVDPTFGLCADWFGGCLTQWPILPSQQPPLFWPLPVQFSTLSGLHEFYHPPPYITATLNTSSYHVLNLMVLSNDLGTGYDLDILIPGASVVLRSITNAAGEIPVLPSNFNSQFEHFVHIPVAQLDIPDIASYCDLEKFKDLAPYLTASLADIRSASTLDAVLQNRFYLDLYANSLTYESCKELIYAELLTQVTVTESSEIVCAYDKSSQYDLWFTDPCCNTDYVAFQCCEPLVTSHPVVLWDTPDTSVINASCIDPVCADSYYSQLTDAVNTLLTKSGCVDSNYANLVSSLGSFNDQLRNCRKISGIGENFDGVDCQVDADCPFGPQICELDIGKCTPPNRTTAENQFLSCFIDTFSVSFEDWLRNNRLPSSLADYDKNSPEFFNAMQSILMAPDCVSNDILQIDQRSRNVFWSADVTCLASVFAVDPNSRILADELCPPFNCLDTSCRVPPTSCLRSCLASYSLTFSSPDNCAADPVCTTEYDPSGCSNTSTSSTCAYCESDGDYPCTTDPALPTDQATCEAAYACELPDGSIEFGLSKEACEALPGSCSVDCYYNTPQICRSLIRSRGVCHVPAYDGDYTGCESLSIVSYYFQDACYLHHAASLEDCLHTPGGVWETCEGLSLSACDGSTVSQRYLQCYASNWGPCASESNCLSAGYCTDRPLAIYYNTTGGSTIHGACFTSGYYQSWIPDGSTECFTSQDRTINGCRTLGSLQVDCTPEYTQPGYAAYQHQVWLNPAITEADCLAQTTGRFGCITNLEDRTVWYNLTACTSCGGTPKSSFEWIPGVWRAPVARPLSWVPEKQLVNTYQWHESVFSFLLVEELVFSFAEFQATFGLRSEALCSFSLIDAALRPLVCACIKDQQECFSSLSPLALVGLSNPCLGKATSLSTPSSLVDFSDVSIVSGCVEIQLSEINRASLGIPPHPLSVSFSLGPRNTLTGVVMNDNGYPVGELASNGLQIDFAKTSTLQSFEVCLLIAVNASTYPVSDFGYTTTYNFVIPLGLSIVVRDVRGETYWCANISDPSRPPFSGTVATFFAVYRIDNFQQPQYETYSQTTVALVYTLAALYIIVLIIVTMGFIWVLYLKITYDRKLPIFAWAAPWFILLCIFRIVYCFGFPDGVWDSSEINNFIVFELPTFFYFTAFVIILSSFISALSSLNPDTTRNLNYCLILAAIIIWLLFISVAIAVGVISGGNTLYSPCPGRVPEQSTIDSQIRALSIAYQSIVIALIFLLAIGFFLAAFLLVRNVSRAHKSVRRAVSILRELFKSTITIVLGFLLRCILFLIILAADFQSSIYMFITLVITEILVISIISLLWWKMSVEKHRESTGTSSRHSGSKSKDTNTSNS